MTNKWALFFLGFLFGIILRNTIMLAWAVPLYWTNPTTDENGEVLTDFKEVCVWRSYTSGDYSGPRNEMCVAAPATTLDAPTENAGTNYFVAVAKDFTGNVSTASNEVAVDITTTTTSTSSTSTTFPTTTFTTTLTTTTLQNTCAANLAIVTADRDRWKREVISARINRVEANTQLKKCIAEKIQCKCP